MWAGLPAVLGIAAGAFVGTNIDNAVVTVVMVVAAPAGRARRIAAGQVCGFWILVTAGIGMAALLFEIPTRAIGLFGLVPLAIGIRGLFGLRHPDNRARLARRAVGSGFVAATLVTIGAGGDNLAVYIPIFRAGHVGGTLETLLVFALGEVILTVFVLYAGQHQRVRAAVNAVAVFGTPVLYCAIGILVLAQAGTLNFWR
jgi:cadmium resistance protein CadD (predicted permease)